MSQNELRETAGKLLTRYCIERDLDPPVELGRCWRLELFDDGFHLDILPVIPDEQVDDGILLSDRDLREWLPSNPIGYADWFYGRMNHRLLEARRAALASELNRAIDEVPRFFVRTPLQRVVQLLKHSRDIYFADDAGDAPPSILITTLAAKAHSGQTTVSDALIDVTATMADHVECRDGVWWVENPAHSGENFADKWNTNPERREAFHEWLAAVTEALDNAARYGAVERIGEALRSAFGGVPADAVQRLQGSAPSTGHKAASGEARAPQEEFIAERFPVDISGDLRLTCEVRERVQPNRYHRRRAERRRRLRKEETLRFSVASTTVPRPYDVYWKVRNFGREALLAKQLRGQILRDDGREERTETRDTAANTTSSASS